MTQTPSILTKIVTPAFITAMAHIWFAYSVVYTTAVVLPKFPLPAIAALAAGIAAFKEFYIDKHFEVGQTFIDNLEDFAGYSAGIALAALSKIYL
jgi:hypothetical protein